MMSVRKFVLLSISSVALLLLGSSQAAALNSIELVPMTDTVNIGDEVSVSLMMNFSEATIGGSVDLSYEPGGISFSSFSWNTSLWTDANLSLVLQGINLPADPADPMTIHFGFLAQSGAAAGLSGQNLLIGTLVFNALTPGTSMITTAYSLSSTGPFYNATAPFPEMAISFGSAQITVHPAPVVPEPSTALLFLVGLAGLSCRSVRKN